MDVALGDYELLIEQSHTYTMQVVIYVEGWTLRRDDLMHSMKYRLGDKYMHKPPPLASGVRLSG
jgi:hypothetical protein